MVNSTILNASLVKEAPYPIWVGRDIFSAVAEALSFSDYSKTLFVVDANVYSAWADYIQRALPRDGAVFPLQITEQAKSIESVQRLWAAFQQHRLDRKSLVVIIGGGVLGDVCGFAAATFMRGIPFAMVPTTLLAQVDASIGGKTACNFGGVKNAIGVITSPQAVLVDISYLRTLPAREFASGVAEMLKHGLIAEHAHFKALAALRPEGAQEVIEDHVRDSLRIKLRIVASDPHEQGARKLLNFGHTLGHAIESSALECGIDLTHGEAIAVGMVGEAFLSQQQGWLTPSELAAIEAALTHWGLPTVGQAMIPREAIVRKVSQDKKNVGSSIRMALLKRMGEGIYDCPISEPALHDSLDYVFRANHSK
ncbi:MAG: 3-dehydroquinate synthase [Deltaproteobacteria bacterium]|nr:3-dehydroquinate synthase [Deltaproteobacteria bacterium]